MPADDLIGCISLDPLRTFVPADDGSDWIEHEDRVIDDRGNEQRESLLALQQLLRDRSLTREVGVDLEDCQRLPGIRLQAPPPCDDDLGSVLAVLPQLTFPVPRASELVFDLLQRYWILGTEQVGSPAADGLVPAEPVQSFRTSVPRGDDAVMEAAHEHGIESQVDKLVAGFAVLRHARTSLRHGSRFLPEACLDINGAGSISARAGRGARGARSDRPRRPCRLRSCRRTRCAAFRPEPQRIRP